MITILYQDTDLVAVNKRPGLLVHPSKMAADATDFALHKLRDQLGTWVYPTHRLDRKTSGVLLFALNKEVQVKINSLFQAGKMDKKYKAIVRGYTDDEGLINYPLTNSNGKVQEAETAYKTLKRVEIQMPHGKHDTSRYSLVELIPSTGRYHQLRKHMAHIHHPILGDRPHGCNKQNRLFKEEFKLIDMMLHAHELSFDHPITEERMVINAPYFKEFKRMLNELSFNESASHHL